MLGNKFAGAESIQQLSFDTRDGIGVDKRALRVLLDSFRVEPETLLEQTFGDPAVRNRFGKYIGHALVKPYSGE